MRHAFTVDLEDWYQGIPVPSSVRDSAERRLNVGTEKLLALLEQHNIHATFFILSPVAKQYGELVRQIVAAGHDVGSHGVSHDLLYEMGPERFRLETRQSIDEIENVAQRRVTSYRAAYFSVTARSRWAFEILASEGIRYDSSVFPIANWRYGISEYPRTPVIEHTSSGPLIEFPMSTRRVLGRNMPCTGGAYFRLYPYSVTRANMTASAARGIPTVFYLHPWELDPEHPKVSFPWRPRFTHYARLRSTFPKLVRLLGDFTFTTLAGVLHDAFPELGESVL